MAAAHNLFQLGCDKDNAHPLTAKLIHQFGDLKFRPDIDPARRLVHHQHARPRREPAGENRLLLIPPAQQPNLLFRVRRRNIQRLDELIRDLLLPPAGNLPQSIPAATEAPE